MYCEPSGLVLLIILLLSLKCWDYRHEHLSSLFFSENVQTHLKLQTPAQYIFFLNLSIIDFCFVILLIHFPTLNSLKHISTHYSHISKKRIQSFCFCLFFFTVVKCKFVYYFFYFLRFLPSLSCLQTLSCISYTPFQIYGLFSFIITM